MAGSKPGQVQSPVKELHALLCASFPNSTVCNFYLSYYKKWHPSLYAGVCTLPADPIMNLLVFPLNRHNPKSTATAPLAPTAFSAAHSLPKYSSNVLSQ